MPTLALDRTAPAPDPVARPNEAAAPRRVREATLRKPDRDGQAAKAAERVVPLDRAHTLITLLVVLYHSVLNYTYFGHGDRMRWLGFDLVALFNDSFFMACMFFISGLFVPSSLARTGPTWFLVHRCRRLGIPFLISIFVVMPIAYYPTFLRSPALATTNITFFQFWWHTLTIGPWPCGSAWFLWVLLALSATAALLRAAAPLTIEALGQVICARRDQPMIALVAFVIFTVAIYLPLHVVFGDSSWLVPCHFPLTIQTSRILLYAGYFFAGIGVGTANLRTGILAENGVLARRWLVWLASASTSYLAILLLVYAHHNWVADFNSPSLWWQTAYGLAFAMFSAAMTFTVPAVFLRFARSSFWLLDAMRPSAYGIYLLHFIPLLWLEYLVLDPAFPAFIKFAIVFSGTLAMSWALTVLLRKAPLIARTI